MNQTTTVTPPEALAAGKTTWTVTDARKGQLKPNPHGGMLQPYWVDLMAEDGTTCPGAYIRKKPENEIKVGDEIYGHIEAGDYGPLLKGDQLPGGGWQNGGNSSTTQTRSQPVSRPESPGPEFWAAKDRRLARAGMMQAVVTSGAFTPGSEHYVEQVSRTTDALLADLEVKTPSPNNGVGVGDGRLTVSPDSGPAPVPDASPATPAQKRSITQYLNKAGVARDYQRAIVHGIAGDPPSKAGCSHILDVLNAQNDLTPEQKVDQLAEEADAIPPSDVPLDESDVPF